MTEKQESVSELNSDQLLTAFTRGGFLKWVVMAAIAHVIAVALLSLGSLVKRSVAPVAPESAETAAGTDAAATAGAGAAPDAAGGVATTNGAASGEDASDAQLLQQRADSPVVRRITDAAKPEDIPSQPGDLGISLEDTKVR